MNDLNSQLKLQSIIINDLKLHISRLENEKNDLLKNIQRAIKYCFNFEIFILNKIIKNSIIFQSYLNNNSNSDEIANNLIKIFDTATFYSTNQLFTDNDDNDDSPNETTLINNSMLNSIKSINTNPHRISTDSAVAIEPPSSSSSSSLSSTSSVWSLATTTTTKWKERNDELNEIDQLIIKYGGYLRANRAAKTIQLAFREYRLRTNYQKICEMSLKRCSMDFESTSRIRNRAAKMAAAAKPVITSLISFN
jgi:hypothetical protein